MKSRSLFLTIAAGLLVSGIGVPDARAANVPLPTAYNALIGNSTTVVGAETLTFSNFTSSNLTGSATLSANAFTLGNETGFSLNGSLFAAAGTTVDVTITYMVSAPAGELLTDAQLLTTGGAVGGGTGTYSVNESIFNSTGSVQLGTLASSPGGTTPTTINLSTPTQTLFVSKDIFLNGGTGGSGVSLSAIDQAFSSSAIPEPSSLALLGIGMTGFLAFRRLFKRTSVA